jgi:hypothetical protein
LFSVRRVIHGLLITIAVTAALVAAPTAAQASTCSIWAGGYVHGYYICEYPPTLVRWPDGHLQWFVVGTTNQVYDSYQVRPGSATWTSWRSLGGHARSSVGVRHLSATRIDIAVYGTYNGWWCKRWTSSTNWQVWWDCA